MRRPPKFQRYGQKYSKTYPSTTGGKMAHRPKQKMDTADNPKVYSQSRKIYLQGRGLRCAYCKPHQGENAGRKQRNWKKFRKTKWRSK